MKVEKEVSSIWPPKLPEREQLPHKKRARPIHLNFWNNWRFSRNLVWI